MVPPDPTPRGRRARRIKDRRFPVHLSHVKLGHEEAIRRQVEELAITDCRFLVQGETIEA